jgi:hypothetical protein
MMSKKALNVILLAKIQPTPGTDSVPVVGTNAVLASEPKWTPLNAEVVRRQNVMGWMGNQGSVIATVYGSVEFGVELQSANTLGVANNHGPLQRGCGMGETIVGATSVSYTPISSAQELLSMYWNVDGIRHAMTDARGTVSYSISARGIPMMNYKFTGFYVLPTDVALVAPTYTGFIPPLAVNKVNTPTFTLHGFAAKVSQLTIDLNNQVEYRNIIGSEEVVIVNREPGGNIVMELPDTVATKDWWTTVRNGTTGTLQVIHGTVSGKKVQIDCPVVQLTSIDYQTEQGVVMISANLDIQPSAGNDELVVKYF